MRRLKGTNNNEEDNNKKSEFISKKLISKDIPKIFQKSIKRFDFDNLISYNTFLIDLDGVKEGSYKQGLRANNSLH